MTKILVIGATGQLGKEIRDMASLYPDFSFLYTGSADLDITDEVAVSNYFAENKLDYVINCAAFTAVDRAENDVEGAEKLNVRAPGYLAEMSARYNIRLIQISTDYVFDGRNHRPYVEDDVVCPNSVYGKTKQGGEQAVLASGCEAMIIRTSWLYSNYGNNFVKTMKRLGEERDELGVIFDQVGTPTNASDLASIILHILSQCVKNQSKFVKGIYHYSNEGVCSWYDFAVAIHEFAGVKCRVKPIESKEYPTPAPRPYYSVLNKSKIKSTFGVEIPHWRESLKKCMDKS